jgi:flagellin-like protein
MWSEKSRSWRKTGKRGVSPIIATILLVAITVVLAAVLYVLISGLTKGPGNQPIGSALAMGTAAESKAGTNYYYNFTIESAGSGITWNSVNFKISGPVAPAATTTWTVLSISAATVVSATGAVVTSWTTGNGGTPCSSTQSLEIISTTNMVAQGEILTIIGVGSFQGTTSATIP